MSKKGFLPVCREDMEKQNIDQLDFVYVCGDAYVDHPSFGHAIISRVLESHGYTVGIISQPNWRSAEEFKKLGRPNGCSNGSSKVKLKKGCIKQCTY